MTRTTNARIAGFTFLAYIAATIASMVIFGHATGEGSVAEKLARIQAHATSMNIVILLSLVRGLRGPGARGDAPCRDTRPGS